MALGDRHKKAGDKRAEVGKAGSPPSGTENEKPPEKKKKDESASLPRVSKRDVGGGETGGGLH